MDKELYLLGIVTNFKKAYRWFNTGSVTLINGVLQLLDMFNLKTGLSESEMKVEIDKVSSAYEKLYDNELSVLNSDRNKWYNKFDGRKIKVNNILLEQLKKFQFR